MDLPKKGKPEVDVSQSPSSVFEAMKAKARESPKVDLAGRPGAVSERLVGGFGEKKPAKPQPVKPSSEELRVLGEEVLSPGSTEGRVRKVDYLTLPRPEEPAKSRPESMTRGVDASQSPSEISRNVLESGKKKGAVKGQSAMEFLMTYSWAIMIMLAAIGVLFYTGVIKPVGPNSCVLPAGFACYSYKIENGGNLTIMLGQSSGQDVTLMGIACSAVDDANATAISNVTIRHGKTATLSNITRCVASDGTYPSRGMYYSGKLVLSYMELETGISHQVKGDVAYTVE